MFLLPVRVPVKWFDGGARERQSECASETDSMLLSPTVDGALKPIDELTFASRGSAVPDSLSAYLPDSLSFSPSFLSLSLSLSLSNSVLASRLFAASVCVSNQP